MKILLVEDDPATRELLAFHLAAARYTVEQAVDGTTALELAVLWNYDLIILDLNIPQLDGLSLCRQLRDQNIATPILILTAQSGDDSLVTGLDAGADDYVTKPFEVQGVLARIRALLRRGTTTTALPSLAWGKLALNPALAQVTYDGQVVPLTPKEYSLLELFLRYPQRVFSRSTILDHLWTIDDSPTEGAVTNLVKDLRNRLKRSGVTETVIQTVYGLGYRLRDVPPPMIAAGPSLSPASSQMIAPSASEMVADSARAAGAETSLAQIRKRFRDSLEGRLATLGAALQSLQHSDADPQAAREEVHRLVGGLGTFDDQKGSALARQMEHLLSQETSLSLAEVAQLDQMFEALKRHLQRFGSETGETTTSGSAPPSRSCCRLLAINLNSALLAQLQAPIAKRGWSLETLSAPAMADLNTHMGAIQGINGVLLALNQDAPLAAKLAPLRDIRVHSPHLPVLVFTSADSLEERVQVAQLRGDRYLADPVTPGQVMDALEQVLPCALPPEPQVLVVDHDPVTRAAITDLLTPWGMRVLGLDNPRQFWEALRETQPDLLLLELDMPTFSGLDLCRVVRQDPQYGNLPTLMLAAHPDTFTVHQVFEAGGDDVIGKPIVEPELVTRVLSRIERSRLRQQLEQMRQTQSFDLAQQSYHDALTQVANSHHFETFLDQQWKQHRQSQAPSR